MGAGRQWKLSRHHLSTSFPIDEVEQGKASTIHSPLASFTGYMVIPKGVVKLTIIAGTYPAQVSKEIDFLVVECPLTYNIILGRLTLNKLKAATLTYYLNVKFPIAHSIGEIKGDQVLTRECYQGTLVLGENLTWVIDELELIP